MKHKNKYTVEADGFSPKVIEAFNEDFAAWVYYCQTEGLGMNVRIRVQPYVEKTESDSN